MAVRVPRVVWLLGLVSLCMDLSSEMIHSLLPLFLVGLGAGAFTLGIIEGIAEGTASISKVFSGTLSDQFARRKPLVVLGYGLAAVSKPLFPLADSANWVLIARFADRIGKGIRGAPRDALLADATPQEIRGAAFGLRQSLDTAGALVGPLAAVALMQLLTNNIRAVFWIATVPAVVAVAVLIFFVKEPARHVDARPPSAFPRRRDLQQLGTAFWIVVVIGAIFTLARFSEAFLVLLAHERGLSLALAPLAMVVMNFTYVLSAYPAGRLSDRIGRADLLIIGLAILIAADIALALGQNVTLVFIGVALWGLHMGLTQGLLAAMVADVAPAELRGSAFGLFHFVSGAAAIAASLLAGGLWHLYGPKLAFLAGAAFSAVAMAALTFWGSRFTTHTS